MAISKNAIRFGGRDVDGRFQFELSGGALALDFANTRDERPRGGVERLTSYERLLAWAEQAGVLNVSEAAQLAKMAAADPAAAERALASARELRELVFSTARRSASSQAPTSLQVRQLNSWSKRSAQTRWLDPRPGGLVRREADRAERLDALLHPVADSIVSLLANPETSQGLRVCAADNCDWLFLDTSRRQNRIWCDMSVCGNRAKARRHYHRSRTETPVA